MPRRRQPAATEDSPPPKRSRYNFRRTRSRILRNKRLGKELGGRKPTTISDEEYCKKSKVLHVEKKPGDALNCKSVDVHCRDNRKLHHTSRYEQKDLIVRRGQSFKLSITFDRKINNAHDVVVLQFTYGSRPTESKNTLFRIPVSVKTGGKSGSMGWVSVTDSVKDSVLTCSVTPPSDAIIGRYDLYVESRLKGDADSVARFKYDELDIIVIFNAWNKDDVVYMHNEKERYEYVMNETGAIWVGSRWRNCGRPWSFGQFEEPCLNALLYLLDRGELDDSARNSAVSIIRKVSAMANSMDDDGVLLGRWTEKYPDNCTKPWEWTGSVAILEEFMKTDEPVEFGQCWVFSGLVTTLLRAVGIPTRSVTNFESAHDCDLSMTIDYHFDESGDVDDCQDDDSKWNFHVWNESWLKRYDLPDGYDGWQAHDATPQEVSEGVMRCGPASLKAIKEGHVYLQYDVGFIYSEVNGDKVTWLVHKDGTMEVDSVDFWTVGKCISTKAVGSNARHDLTLDYKYADGSAKERKIAEFVNRFSSRKDWDIYKKEREKELDIKLDLPSDTLVGDDIEIKMTITNKVNQQRTIRVKQTLVSSYYTGIRGERICCETEEYKLKPRDVKTVTFSVRGKDYEEKRNPEGRFTFLYHIKNLQTNRVYVDTESFTLDKPSLCLKRPEPLPYGEDSRYEVKFKNTTKLKLTNALFKLDTNGQLTDGVVTRKLKKPIQPGQEVKEVFTLYPHKRYRNRVRVIVSFSSDQVIDVTERCKFKVIDPPESASDDSDVDTEDEME